MSSENRDPQTTRTYLPDATGEHVSTSDPAEAALARAGPFAVEKFLARGGMGSVYRCLDADMGRSLAVKVLQQRLAGQPAAVERFLSEAKLTARLQHPGIPPVHVLGRLEDERPFFAMKLIQGQTLAQLLANRPTPGTDLARFLNIFTSVAQTIGYAHSQGVIHRDLKPANVMVGAFGEVQVMDWGLAKDLASRERERPETTTPVAHAPGSPENTEQTQAGTILGTPAYMAPEQARGQVLDKRGDVFGLGAILCEVLTGQPPFTPDRLPVLERAAQGDLTDAFARLDRGGADTELIALARNCLSAQREQRPSNGAAVAEAITAHQTGVQDRLQQAERQRERAELRAVEERKRRRLAVFLAVAVLGLIAVVGVGYWAWQRQQQRDAERLSQGRQSVEELLNRAEGLLSRARWNEADSLLDQARQRLDELPEGTAERPFSERLREALTLGRKLDELRSERLVLLEGGTLEAALPPLYRETLAPHGFDVETGDPGTLGRAVSDSPVRETLLAALDDWAVLEPDPLRRERVLAVARLADAGGWQDRFRAAKVRSDRKLLEELAREANLDKLPAATVVALGTLLDQAGADPIPLLRGAQGHRPDDFWLCFSLGVAILQGDPGKQSEAVAMFEAARALRPDSVQVRNNLGRALEKGGDMRRAEEVLRQLTRERPDFAPGWGNLALTLRQIGKGDEGLAAARRAIALLEKGPHSLERTPHMYNTLGMILGDQGDRVGELAAFRQAVSRRPRHSLLLANLALTLANAGQIEESRARWQQAFEAADEVVRRNPRDYEALAHRGRASEGLGDLPRAEADLRQVTQLAPASGEQWSMLGHILLARGQTAEARSAFLRCIDLHRQQGQERSAFLSSPYERLSGLAIAGGQLAEGVAFARQAVAVEPRSSSAYSTLAWALGQDNNRKEAEQAGREAIRLGEEILQRQPDRPRTLRDMGQAWDVLGQPAQATAAFRKALLGEPQAIGVRVELAQSLWRWGTPAALAEARTVALEGIRLRPDHAPCHYQLCVAARRLGRLDEAITAGRNAVRLDPKGADNKIVLASALAIKGNHDEAVVLLRQVVAEHPGYHIARRNLAVGLFEMGRWHEAAAEASAHVQMTTPPSVSYLFLANARVQIGDLPGGLLAFRKALSAPDSSTVEKGLVRVAVTAIELDLASDARVQGVLGATVPAPQRLERLLALHEHLDGVVAGKVKPRDVEETLRLARFATLFAQRHVVAVRLFADAFTQEPARARDLSSQVRFIACQAALRAALGPGLDTPRDPEAPERKPLRQQALIWLRDEVAARRVGLLLAGLPERLSRSFLQALHKAPQLEELRRPFTQRFLSVQERQDWAKFLADLDRLLAPPRMPPAAE